MKVGSTVGGSAGNRRAELPVLTVFFICCMIFSGVLYAQETPETKQAATEVPTTEVPAAEVSAESVASEDSQDSAALKLEETLKKNNKCLRCHKRDKTKLLEDGEEMSLQVHKEESKLGTW